MTYDYDNLEDNYYYDELAREERKEKRENDEYLNDNPIGEVYIINNNK